MVENMRKNIVLTQTIEIDQFLYFKTFCREHYESLFYSDETLDFILFCGLAWQEEAWEYFRRIKVKCADTM